MRNVQEVARMLKTTQAVQVLDLACIGGQTAAI
jgi:hypothetical protein